jgi:hypothetical protein
MGKVAFGTTCLLIAGFGLAAPVAAQDTSDVVMTRDGARTELRHVRATRFVPESGEAEIRLLFSSADPGDVVLADAFGRDTVARWVQASGAIAVKVSFEETTPEQFQVTAYTGETMVSGGGHASGGERIGAFRALDLAADRVSGELDNEMGSVALSGTFRASLAPAAETPAVTGAQVASSPQARVLLEFARAMSRMDLEAAQPHAAGDLRAQMAEAAEMLGKEAITEMIAERFGDLAALERRLGSQEASLQESGDRAVITLVKKTVYEGGHSTESESYRFVKVGSDWKISM